MVARDNGLEMLPYAYSKTTGSEYKKGGQVKSLEMIIN